MAVIVLLTDFGQSDEYVGVVKGVISGINPRAKIIDLCHDIPPQDITWANYLLGSAYKFFPKGTIFLCVVDPGVGTKRKIVILETKEYIFISPDNGLLTKVLEKEKSKKIVEVKDKRFFLKEISSTFHGRDIMAPVAGYISKGIDLERFGSEMRKIKTLKLNKPIMKKDCLIGEVIHIDHFGNLVTNIEKGSGVFWQKITQRGQSHFYIEIKKRKIYKINKSYAESKKGELLAIWGSRNLLEISLSCGNAEKELGVKKGEKIWVNFS
ncbi:MAG: SAM-dependent chlorinase/fluorinase [Candidatus Omnitrophica bacterium]|nr:SAM-dependent chlorinase/fluorinase [Candidatus Omnitrophota bacterium]MCM8798048.1 SAM-dependent chlorinase/fluorinase [Candidatus Omnitrophota bacterium]